DLPGERPVLLGRPPGDQRRHLGLARGRKRPGEGDAPGRRPAEARARPVPRAGGVRAVRLRARSSHATDTCQRRTHGCHPQPAAVLAVADGGAGGRDLRRDQRLPRRDARPAGTALPGRAARAHADREVDPRRDPRAEGDLRRARGEAERRAEALRRHVQRPGRERARLVASVQDLKRRIRSIRNTRKITKAMELVASARLRRAQARIEAMRPYADRMMELMVGTARASSSVRGLPLLQRREEERAVAILPLTGDRGLAGAFNAQVLRHALALDRQLRAEGKRVRWLVSGRRGSSTLRFRRFEVLQAWTGFSDRPAYM